LSLYKEWNSLTEGQNESTFDAFWKSYCDAEIKLYTALLSEPESPMTGTFGSLRERYGIDPVLFMGFLDGINSSLKEKICDLEGVTEETELSLSADFPALYYNMQAAEAAHLYGLEAWDGILGEDERAAIAKEYKRSKTVVKEKEPGRNDPCPCGSGKKYKYCCGKNA